MMFLVNTYQQLRNLFTPKGKDAATAWQESGGEHQHAFWMYAPPVNLVLGRDSFFLSKPAPLAVTQDESKALIDSLNQHFANDGYHFYLQGDVWFLGLDKNPNITTSNVAEVEGKDIAAFLPKGKGDLTWATLQNEMQMLLFSHTVNQTREAQDLPLVNSVWCYGLGEG